MPQYTTMHLRTAVLTTVAAVGVTFGMVPPAAAQLGGRSAEEWIKTLEWFVVYGR